MSKINSKNKGKRGELEWAKKCRENGYKDARRTQQFAGINNDSDVVGLPGIHMEVKRVERLNISDAMVQAKRDCADGFIPIVAHRKNNEPWLVTMNADDWFELYREWEAGKYGWMKESCSNCAYVGKSEFGEHLCTKDVTDLKFIDNDDLQDASKICSSYRSVYLERSDVDG